MTEPDGRVEAPSASGWNSAPSANTGVPRKQFLQRVALALLAGALGGLTGGVLTRLAMRLLTLTSTDEARGPITDD